MSRTPILVSHSGGKDSILLLDRLLRDDRWEIVSLISLITVEDQRVSMHGVPRKLLEAQAAALGLPLTIIEVPRFPTNAIYESALEAGLKPFRAADVTTIAFGDLFLADIRRYREDVCSRLGMVPLFPLWNLATPALAEEFIDRGFRAVVCCIDARCLMADFAGRHYDAGFLRALPNKADWCGENGEFHTFVWNGPNFRDPVSLSLGATTRQGDFWYVELSESETDSDFASLVIDVPAKSVERVDV